MAEDQTLLESQDNIVWRKLNALIEFLEKQRFTPLTAFIFMVLIGVVRSVAESLFFEYRVFSMYLLAQHVAFNFPVLVMGVLIIKLATGESLIKVYNIILLGFVFVMAPPFLDYYILGLGGIEQSSLYAYYAADATFIEKIPDLNFLYMFMAEEISPGLKRMAMMILGSSGLYIAIKIRINDLVPQLKKRMWIPSVNKVCSLFFGIYGIWIVIWFISAIVPTIIKLGDRGVILLDYFVFRPYSRYYEFITDYGYTWEEVFSPEQFSLSQSLVLQQRSLFITMFFFTFTVVMMIISLYIVYRPFLKKTLRSLKTSMILATTVPALLGSSILHLFDPDFTHGWALDPSYVLHFPYIFYITAIGFFLGCFGSYAIQYKKDEGLLSTNKAKHMMIISILAGGSLAFLVGATTAFPLFLTGIILMYFSFSDGEYLLTLKGTLPFSLACMFSFFIGVYTPNVWRLTILDNGGSSTLTLPRNPPLNAQVLGLAIMIFLVVFLLTYIPTIFRKFEKNFAIPHSIVFVPLFFLPLLVHWNIGLITVFGTLSISSIILFSEDFEHIPLGAFMVGLSYMMLDLYGIIPSLL
ncbi:MAG: hypothetical protein R6W73_09960 [Candidatus Saliniplasma sp.]